MNLGSVGLTIAAGIATFLIVGVAVTELLQPRIEFSLLIGIPAGLLAGAVVAAAVARGVGDGAPAQRRRVALSFGAFATGFLVVLLGASFLPVGTVIGILVGIGVGIVVAVGTYLRSRRRTPDQQTGSPPN